MNTNEWVNPVLIKKIPPKEVCQGKPKRSFAIFRCHCGAEFEARLDSIAGQTKSGKSTSCGCIQKKTSSERIKQRNTTHGDSKNSLYIRFKHLQSKGKLIGSSWDKNYYLFKKWALENNYHKSLELTTINKYLPHDVNNCLFVTREVLNRMSKKIWVTNKSGYRGVSFSNSNKKWQAQISISNKNISIGFFHNPYDASIAYDKFVIKNNLEHRLNHNDIWGTLCKLDNNSIK